MDDPRDRVVVDGADESACEAAIVAGPSGPSSVPRTRCVVGLTVSSRVPSPTPCGVSGTFQCTLFQSDGTYKVAVAL
jgi:hypothetical protein